MVRVCIFVVTNLPLRGESLRQFLQSLAWCEYQIRTFMPKFTVVALKLIVSVIDVFSVT